MTPAQVQNASLPGARCSRRVFMAGGLGGIAASSIAASKETAPVKKARIAITFDLEMSRMYPTRDMTEWDFQKGNLNAPTKQYSLASAHLVKERGGLIHFFCVGRVLEQPSIDWLTQIAAMGHPIGNHTYDHVNVWSTKPEQTQFRFQRSPWLIRGKAVHEIVRENIRMTTLALKQRAGIVANGFRTPGGSAKAFDGREDLQQLLLDEGFQWVSSKYPPHQNSNPPTKEVFDSIVEAQRAAQPYVYPTGLVEIPMSPVSDVNAFRSNRWKLSDFLKAIRLSIEWTIENGAVFDFLCHPSCMYVEDPKMDAVRLICDLVEQAGDKAEIVGLDHIAERVGKLPNNEN